MKNKVKVSLINDDSWHRARKYARRTVSKDDINSDVSNKFKRDLCISEHSPIREVKFEIELTNVPVTTSQQFSRHRIATVSGDFLHETTNPLDVEHYVQSQRPDNTGVDRSKLTNYTFTANIQGLIDMSKKRLCHQAERETLEIWREVVKQIGDIEPIVAGVLVPTCIYRGFCPEFKCCGYDKTAIYTDKLYFYRNF